MNNTVKDLYSIRKMGIEALTEKLGPVGMAEFMRQFDSGCGDYTKERNEWLGDRDIGEISKQIEAKRRQ